MSQQYHNSAELEAAIKKLMKESSTDGIFTATTVSSADLTTLRSNILLGSVMAPAYNEGFLLTDGLLQSKIVYWNGEAFNTNTGSVFNVITKHSSTQIGKVDSSNTSADTTAVVLEEITIPGFLCGKKSKLRIAPLWQIPNSATSKTVIISAYTAASGDQVVSQNSATTSLLLNHLHEIRFLDSYTSQKTCNQVSQGNTTNPLLATGFDAKTDFNLRFKGSWGAAALSESISLLGYSIELLP